MSEIARIIDGKEVERKTLPCGLSQGSVSMPGRLTADMLAAGWRDVVLVAGQANVKASTWADTGSQWVESVTRYTAEELAQRAADAAEAQAAAEAAEAIAPRDVALGKATLRTYPDGSVELLSGPLILPGTTNGAYEVWVDAETGLVLTTLDHASPRKSKADKDAAKAARKAKIAAVKAAKNDAQKLDALLDLLGLK